MQRRHLVTQKSYMKDVECKANARADALKHEQNALNSLFDTLNGQNKGLMSELDTQVSENEAVRVALDRRDKVAALQAEFDRTI